MPKLSFILAERDGADRRYGCQGCHSIPGIRDAKGVVGPPLDKLANRVYIAGELPNTTEAPT